ncbi:hypothetical protein E2C01_069441 [Portunus trituberculatus]|uniref:Uncharacterized protein n=1 Tax=Portunus trituberculatus TaxID=210409 RepID=A0A5B7I0S9_PORTR|nr:hypothetical protein [Portunus trituberculatus]
MKKEKEIFRRNVPGTHRKVALHDESFDGTQQNSLVQNLPGNDVETRVTRLFWVLNSLGLEVVPSSL